MRTSARSFNIQGGSILVPEGRNVYRNKSKEHHSSGGAEYLHFESRFRSFGAKDNLCGPPTYKHLATLWPGFPPHYVAGDLLIVLL
jgi:hypothetical protein